MLTDIIRNGFTFTTDTIISLLASIFVVFCVMPIHEFSHALVGTILGDETPRLKGRLTINPMAHIDWMGALLFIFAGFGWGKPVNVSIRNFKMKNKKLGVALVALAGPLSNIIMAFISLVLMFVVIRFSGNSTTGSMTYNVVNFLFFAASLNVSLAVFNLIPVPPLDGSRLISIILPNKLYYKLMMYERYIVLVIMVLLFTGVLSKPLMYMSNIMINLLFNLASFPLKF